MQTNKQASLFSNLSDKPFNLFDFGLKVESSKKEKPEKITVYETSDGIWRYDHPFCKHCNSRKVVKHSTNAKMVFSEDGKKHQIRVQRYKCKKCGKFSQTEFNEDYKPYCNYPNSIKEKINKTQNKEHSSLRSLAADQKIYHNLSVSHETVRKCLHLSNSLFYKNEKAELSGYYSYDAQWFPINKKWIFRLVLFDLNENVPVGELISENEDPETIKKFISDCIPAHKRIAIVTDLQKSYDKIMRELGFVHQKCTFHLRLNMNEQNRIFIKKSKHALLKKFKNKYPQASKSQINRYLDEKIKIIKKDLNSHMALIFELFNQQTYDKAIRYVDLLKSEIKSFPPHLRDYMVKNFFPNYKSFLFFLKKEHKGLLGATNNRIENYIGNTMPKSLKRKFRTKLGFFNHIRHRIKGWIENQKNQLTN